MPPFSVGGSDNGRSTIRDLQEATRKLRLASEFRCGFFGLTVNVDPGEVFAETIQKLYWVEEIGEIKRSNLDGSQVETVLAASGVTYLAADQTLGKLFYAIGSPTPQLWSADFNGDNRRLLATLDTANYVRGLDFDAYSQTLFWTSSNGYVAGNGKIRSADADGSNLRDVLTFTEPYPYGMAIDSAIGKMFWSNTIDRTIEQANLDGSSRHVPVTDTKVYAAEMTLDPVSQKLYWFADNDILWSNYDGTEMASIGSVTGYTDFGLTVDHSSGFLFWTDTREDAIFRANLDGSDATAIVTDGLSNPGSMIVLAMPEPYYPSDVSHSPEPSSLVLALLATLGLSFYRRRRQRTA